MTNDAQTVDPVAELLACREALARAEAALTDPKYIYAGGRIQRAAIESRNAQIHGYLSRLIQVGKLIGLRNGSGDNGERLLARIGELVAAEAERATLAGQLAAAVPADELRERARALVSAAERAQLERDCAVLCEECRSPDDAEPMVRQGPAELINGIWYHRRFVKSDGVELGSVRCSARRLRSAALAGADTLRAGGAGIDAPPG